MNLSTHATPRVAFQLALNNAKSGTHIVYHVGSLAYDRQPVVLGQAYRPHACAIGDVSDAAYEAYNAGKCHLVQRRTGRVITETEHGKVYEFEYIAVKK